MEYYQRASRQFRSQNVWVRRCCLGVFLLTAFVLSASLLSSPSSGVRSSRLVNFNGTEAETDSLGVFDRLTGHVRWPPFACTYHACAATCQVGSARLFVHSGCAVGPACLKPVNLFAKHSLPAATVSRKPELITLPPAQNSNARCRYALCAGPVAPQALITEFWDGLAPCTVSAVTEFLGARAVPARQGHALELGRVLGR